MKIDLLRTFGRLPAAARDDPAFQKLRRAILNRTLPLRGALVS